MENNFKKITKFTDLVTWQEAHKLALLIYKIVKSFPREERFSLIDQMRRAAVSVTSNIAEGFGRKSSKDKNQFYTHSKGSLIELQNQLILSKDVGYLKDDIFREIAKQTVVVHKLLVGLIKATRLKEYEH